MPGQLSAPLIIAHRGASAHAPENTLAAFRLAAAMGADGIELDAKLTLDGHIVVIHDPTVDRTTDGTGEVGRLTLAQIKKLDAGSFFDSQFANETIPTLEEVFQAVGGKLLINVELTNYNSTGDDLPRKAAALVRSSHLENSVLFSSFFPGNLAKVRKSIPKVQTGLLTMPGLAGWLMYALYNSMPLNAVHPHFSRVTQHFIASTHARHRKVNTWTVNEPEVMKKLTQYGVDGIITDDPRLARSVIQHPV